jgi:hypothetical protein
MATVPKCKLTAIIAEKKRVGVIFRRGPTKQVRLIKWNLAKDTFELGQWFKGRIYEDLCDLSPEGELLVTYATKASIGYWTAVSRPPYLTALALWPIGGGSIGGGLLRSEKELVLYHPGPYRDLKEGFAKPPIRILFEQNRWNPRFREARSVGLLREKYGWELVDAGEESATPYRDKGRVSNLFRRPRVMQKTNGLSNKREAVLFQELLGYNEAQGDHKVLSYHAERQDGVRIEIGRAQWADWGHNGDLFFSRGGTLYRVSWKTGYDLDVAQTLADFSDQRFEALEVPKWALKW